MNVEELMMQALDGTIGPTDRARLEAYFAEHPDERAGFERMLAMDAALRGAPLAAPPSGFAQAVVARARHVPLIRPLKRRYVVTLAVTNCALAALVWAFVGIALTSLLAILSQQPLLQPLVAFTRGITIYTADTLNVLTLTVRSFIMQPFVWLMALASTAVVAAWLGIMIKVLVPARRLA